VKKRWCFHLHKRYGRFQCYCLTYFSLYLIAALVGCLVFGSYGTQFGGTDTGVRQIFVSLLTGETILFFLTFLLGITVYAPAFGGLSSFSRGVLGGFVAAFLLPPLEIRGWVVFLLYFAYQLASSWLYAGYAAFCSVVAMRLFTDGTVKTGREEEGRIFGGTLFNSRLFCNTVNLRFLSTYCLVFFSSLLFLFFLTSMYALLRSLIYV